jgi:hypothetical protein
MTKELENITNQTVEIPIKEKRKIEFVQPTKIKLGYSFNESMGLGVFATKDIEPGELIERCYMVQLADRSRYQHDRQIKRYLYTNRCSCQQCMIHGVHMNMVLGYGMIYNHQDEPNTEWNFKWADDYADIICVKQIKEGQEIFVYYGSSYFKGREYFSQSGDSVIPEFKGEDTLIET